MQTVHITALSGYPLSGYLYRPVVIAMTIVGIMQMTADQVVDMVSMWNSLVAAPGSVHMSLLMHSAFMPRCAVFRICLRHGYDVFINMAAVRGVQVAVVQIVDVIVMNNTRVATFRTVGMSMIFMLWQVTISHCRFLMRSDEIAHRPLVRQITWVW
jgi:hypothetical protein